MGLRDLLGRGKRMTAKSNTAATAKMHASVAPVSASLLRNKTPASVRMQQLLDENARVENKARLVRRKYQSLMREREDRDCELDTVVQYEIEFPVSGPLGIDLETDFYGRHAVVRKVQRHSAAYALAKQEPRRILRPGHIVVAVNGQDVSRLAFAQVLDAIRNSSFPRVLRFLNPSLLPIAQLQHESVLVNRDQYGFAKEDAYILEYRKHQRKRQDESYEHEKRWAEFLQRWHGLDSLDQSLHKQRSDTDAANSTQSSNFMPELRSLVLGGVPVVLRPRVWGVLAHVTPYKKRFAAAYFLNLVEQREFSPSLCDIEKDLCRTYPEHAFFQSERGKGELKNVLCAYSLHDPAIGYCQSMNFIVGMMLLFMSEEDAFWLLCVMMQPAFLPADNYAHSMVGTQIDQLVFQRLVERELPELAAHLTKCGIQIHLITLHWFLCAFVCTLPTEAALRVWDWFFLDGQEVLFAVAIGILKLEQTTILSVKTHTELHAIVRRLGTHLHDEDALMVFLCSLRPRTERRQNENGPQDQVASVSKPIGQGTSFTMSDIEALRTEFRRELETKPFSSLQ